MPDVRIDSRGVPKAPVYEVTPSYPGQERERAVIYCHRGWS